MSQSDEEIEMQAASWAVRVAAPDFEDWQALAQWMEKSPLHAHTFNEIVAEDARIANVVPKRTNPAPKTQPLTPGRFSGWKRRIGNGVRQVTTLPDRHRYAAIMSVLVVVGISAFFFVFGSQNQTVVTTKTLNTEQIALSEGVNIRINGNSSLAYDPGDHTAVTLRAGEAYFSILHRPDRTFKVAAGDVMLTDIGTQFNVLHTENVTEVAVSEGEVRAERGSVSFVVTAGEGLRFLADGSSEKFSVSPRNIATWRDGSLTYIDAPLARVAEDISRTYGVRVSVSPSLSGSRFTGRIALDADGASVIRQAAMATGTVPQPNGDGWVLGDGEVVAR